MRTFVANLREDLSGFAKRTGVDPLLTAAQVLLYVVLVGVILAQVMTVVGLVAYVFANVRALGAFADGPAWLPVVRLLLGFAALGLIFKIVQHLLGMIRAVGLGQAFAMENVGRLENIAAHALGLQIIGTVAAALNAPIGGNVNGFDVGFGLSPAGIAFVLLLFILARVFRQGAAMREEMEGTV